MLCQYMWHTPNGVSPSIFVSFGCQRAVAVLVYVPGCVYGVRACLAWHGMAWDGMAWNVCGKHFSRLKQKDLSELC